MLQYVCDNSPEVRQAAAYGLGVMAQYGGDNYRPFCTGIVFCSVRVIPAASQPSQFWCCFVLYPHAPSCSLIPSGFYSPSPIYNTNCVVLVLIEMGMRVR